MVPVSAMRKADDLALYYFESCPYCQRVLRALDELGVAVDRRDIEKSQTHLRDLVAARGRRTVPVLRITEPNGDTWLPESLDILAYLRKRFA